MKISFHSYANKTNFHMNSFALSLAFIVRFTTTRKWPIVGGIAFQSVIQVSCKCPMIFGKDCRVD